MNDNSKPLSNRRRFLKAASGASVGGFILGGVGRSSPVARAVDDSGQATVPPDLSQDPRPTGADIGSLFPTIERMAKRHEFAYSFRGDRFRSLDEFKAAGRAKLLECFGHFVPSLHQYLDMPDVVSMMAPKPLMLQQCQEDGLYPLAGMRASLEKIAAVYEKAGVKERFTGRFFPGGHRFDQPMQNAAFDWLDGHLKS